MIRRPPRSTLSSSSAASDVYKRQGYLNKLSKSSFGLGGWQCRWVVLSTDGFVYYFDDASDELCSDVLPLDGGAAFPHPKHSDPDLGLAFGVGHRDFRTLVFATDNQREYDGWLNALQTMTVDLPLAVDEKLAKDKGYDPKSVYSNLDHNLGVADITSPRAPARQTKMKSRGAGPEEDELCPVDQLDEGALVL
eukprot:TRINITY_DN2830_c0_g1_i1.p2 TRINITY_DN2830_c0_g1~~TRINITY_DN2830_c0_g1_i1.p2  ORF type:complete len:193 (+),score=37.94 TRINITY_DN2830_c0_g1_i1:88-666(+)